MELVKLAVLGLGPMGISMAVNAHKTGRVKITAFCDCSSKALNHAVTCFEAVAHYTPETFSSFDDLTQNGDYEGIMIACNPQMQADFSVREMKRNKHVLCQVPVAVTMEECFELVKTARETGVVYVGAEQAYCWDFIGQWKEMARTGELGHIFFAQGEYLHYEPKWDWFIHNDTGESVFTDNSDLNDSSEYRKSWRHQLFCHPIFYTPHTLNPLLQITGGNITKVSCVGTKPESYCAKGFAVRDLETAVMYNDKDIVFTLQAGFTTPHGFKAGTGAHWYALKGSKGSVEWARSEVDTPKYYQSETKEWVAPPWSLQSEEATDLEKASGHGGADMAPILSFLDAVQKGIPADMDAVACARLTAPAIAAAQSSEQGGALIEVPQFE